MALWIAISQIMYKPQTTETEQSHLIDLINHRFDRRIHYYGSGQKLWDIATTNVVALIGRKK
ncbi:hypothetical protein NIE88_01520 [Sporolactobacillus shoreicorticis]|uniref:Uncharacterized protein n=1 Tax=Sporolactobacillus shoreicorticis TaxID=1923877 RepID=A0ABW5S4N8_9BACL|nr:hypothetical protein [Sporolactobacillus shoreicorticis]MCO7124458.1 hypothetical protein [Sporolactobacillus shoreicorticis]